MKVVQLHIRFNLFSFSLECVGLNYFAQTT